MVATKRGHRMALRKHSVIHSEKKFVCDYPHCQYRTYKRTDVLTHKSKHEKQKITKPTKTETKKVTKAHRVCQYFCHYSDCDKGFKNAKSFEHHLWIHKNNDNEGLDCLKSNTTSDKTNTNKKSLETNGSVNEFVCHYEDCGQRFKGQKTLNYHLWKHQKNDKFLVCSFPGCDYKTDLSYRIRDHERTHTGETPFECHLCHKKFTSKRYVRVHTWKEHNVLDQPIVCNKDNCNKQFKTEFSFRAHQKCHTNKKSFVCDRPDCQYITKFKFCLDNHMANKHTIDRPFKCHIEGCHKAFKLGSALNGHIERHLNEPIHKCPHEGCDKSFKFKQYLNRHFLRNHSDKWQFCDWPGCEYKSRRKSTMDSHSASHSNQYTVSCIWPNCDKKFKTKQYMRSHLLTHKQEKRHVCHWPGCQYRCITAGNLKIHINNRHKNV